MASEYAKTQKSRAGKRRVIKLRELSRSGNAACRSAPEGDLNEQFPNLPTDPVLAPVSDDLSLEPFTNAFGIVEARRLLKVFGFGATKEEVDRAVQEGLNATVTRLTTWVSEPQLDAYIADIECDQFDANENRQFAERVIGYRMRTCNASDRDDLDLTGVRYGMYARYLRSQNQYFQRMAFFLMNEFMAVSADAAETNSQFKHMVRDYLDMVYNAARSGNFKQFMSQFATNELGAMLYLNLGTSNAPAPNQDFAREFWQLGTIGQQNLDGIANYGELDIIAASNALAGWRINYLARSGATFERDPAKKVPGLKTVFRGTPYEAKVNDIPGLVRATFIHPSASENVAKKIWNEFISSDFDPTAIRHLAKVIRDSDFNLNRAMRVVMSSRAFFADRARGTLFKHPLQLVLGLMRELGLKPVDYLGYSTLDLQGFNKIGQVPLRPPSVFGWRVMNFQTASSIRATRDTFVNLPTGISFGVILITYVRERFEMQSLQQNLFPGLDASDPHLAEHVMRRVVDRLGMSLPPSAYFTLTEMTSNQFQWCSEFRNLQPACGSIVPDVITLPSQFTLTPHQGVSGLSESDLKIISLIYILADSPEYRTN